MKKKVEKKTEGVSLTNKILFILIIFGIIYIIFGTNLTLLFKAPGTDEIFDPLEYEDYLLENDPEYAAEYYDDLFETGEYWRYDPIELIEECVFDIGTEAVDYVGLNGGYIDEQNNKVVIDDVRYTTFFDGSNRMPIKGNVVAEIQSYLKEYLGECTFDLYSGKIDVEIDDEDVVILMDPPVDEFGVEIYDIEDFLVAIPLRLGLVYDAVNSFVKDQVSFGGSECIDCFNRFSDDLAKDGLSVEKKRDGNLVSYIVSDDEPIIEGFEYEFRFANKYVVGRR